MDTSPMQKQTVGKHRDGSHHPHHRILSIEVAGGFLDGTRLEFSDGLNCIIGGRGTGKTTVLEFIRYILGMMPDVADSRPRAKAIEGHVQGQSRQRHDLSRGRDQARHALSGGAAVG